MIAMLTALLPALLMLVTVGLNTLAQALLKLGSSQNPLNIYLFSGVVVYGFSTVFYVLVLSKFDLSTAYPIVIGLTVLATTVTGAFLLGERVAATHWLGIGLMLSGISTIAFSK